jgi:heptosyltransferase-1
VIRLGAMGDILHALPAVTALRLAHPDWQIDWVVEPRWRALLAADDSFALKGHDFSRAAENPLSEPALAAEGCISSSQTIPQGLKPHLLLVPSDGAAKAAPFQNNPTQSLFQNNPAQPVVDHLHFAATKAWRKALFSRQTRTEFMALRAALKAADYDAVIDLQGSLRSALIASLAGCRRLIGEENPRERPARWLFTERVATHGAHVIEQDLELASAIAGDNLQPVLPWLPVDPAAEAWADEILPEGDREVHRFPGPKIRIWGIQHSEDGQLNNGQPAVLINPGAGWGAKRWPAERYAAVAQGLIELGYRVLINVGPGEEPLAEVIVRQTAGAATALTCSLAQLIALTRRVRLAIAGDTGPLHLACALGVPVVGVYGPTDPSRNGPFGSRFTVLRSPESRRDHSRYEAPEAGLLTIQPKEVLHAAGALLYPEKASEANR